MPRFPVDAPLPRMMRTLERLGFVLIREGNHIAMLRQNADDTRTPLTMPNHRTIKARHFAPGLTQVMDYPLWWQRARRPRSQERLRKSCAR